MNLLRALWLAARIWRPSWHPRYDPHDPFDSITWQIAWKVSKGVWLQ